MYKGIQSSIRSNTTKTLILIMLFPIFLWLIISMVFAILVIWETSIMFPRSQARAIGQIKANEILIFLGPILFVRCVLSFMFHRKIIFKFAGARPMTKEEFPEVRDIIENLCISRWLSVPNIGIIWDLSMNAFVVGWNPKNSWIVVSSWLLRRLNRAEIEAVAAHELTHIINKDSLLMIVIVVFIGSIEMLWWLLIYGKSKGKHLFFIGLALLILWYLIYPLIWFALSRKREYIADAGSVILTKDKYSMISALQKISKNSEIEQIKKRVIASMCIANPRFSIIKTSIFSTHPSIKDRIKALQSY